MLSMTKAASTDCIQSSRFDSETEPSPDQEVYPEMLRHMADTHSEPSIANLIDLDSISLHEVAEQPTIEVGFQ